MLPLLRERFGNPSSLHRRGADASRALEDARIDVARALGREQREIVFTSGATEANNLAILGAARALKRRGDHVVATAVEHPSVLEPLRALEAEGFRVSLAPVRGDGNLDVEALLALIEEKTVLVSVMHVQNETGALFPIDLVAARAKQKKAGLVFHSDGAQALGKTAPPSRAVDLYTVSAHKVHGPLGAGALAIAKGVRVLPLVVGGGQEQGLRNGTENLPALVGFAAAARRAAAEQPARAKRDRALRERFVTGLASLDAVVNSPADGIASTLHVSFPGAASEPLLHALEERGVFASSGSACSQKKSGHGKSHVLEAMNLPPDRKSSALRFSFGATTTEGCVDRALVALRESLAFARSLTRR
jgi:cysteine desulfurase